MIRYRRIEITPRDIYWNEGGELVCISTEESFFILKYNSEAAAKALQTKENLTEDGVEDAFDVVAEIQEVVKTGAVVDVASHRIYSIGNTFPSLGASLFHHSPFAGLWVGDCFLYTNTVNRLNYYVGGEIVTISHLDRVMYLLGYIPKDNRVYLGDKDLNIVSFQVNVVDLWSGGFLRH